MYKSIPAMITCILLLSACSRNDETSYTQKTSDPSTAIVKSCAIEAGIPADDPKHAITPAEMEKLTKCIDSKK
jgi:hypothetical protein